MENDQEFGDRLRIFSESLELISGDRLEKLKSADGLIGKILVGHLFAEELVSKCLEIRCYNYQHLEAARLSFFQKVSLVRSFEIFPALTDEMWPSVMKLNSIRNHLAHEIERPNIDRLSREFIHLVIKSQKTGNKIAKKFGLRKFIIIDVNSNDALFQAMHYTLGQLQAVTLLTNHIEELTASKIQST